MTQDNHRTQAAANFPKVVLIDTTNRCNLRCSMCGRQAMTRKLGTMPPALFCRIINEIAETDRNTRVWLTFFGEPLLLGLKLLWQIRYAKGAGLQDVVINTNGQLLTETMSRNLIGSGLDAIYIGIDAATAETYSKLRVGGNFQKVVENVNMLLDLERASGSLKKRVYVQFVEMEENKHEIGLFRAYWTIRGAVVKIRPKVTWAGTVSAYGNKDDIPRHPCYWLMQTMSICWDGSVALCAVDYNANYKAGNINESTIQEIWKGELAKMRAAHGIDLYESGVLPEFCEKCTDWQMASAAYYNNTEKKDG